MRTEVAEVLIDVEAHLRQLGHWDKVPPSSNALASDQPFCVDTLTLPQWLQFIFLPTIYGMLDSGEALPARCGIAPMAEEYTPRALPAKGRGGIIRSRSRPWRWPPCASGRVGPRRRPRGEGG